MVGKAFLYGSKCFLVRLNLKLEGLAFCIQFVTLF